MKQPETAADDEFAAAVQAIMSLPLSDAEKAEAACWQGGRQFSATATIESDPNWLGNAWAKYQLILISGQKSDADFAQAKNS